MTTERETAEAPTRITLYVASDGSKGVDPSTRGEEYEAEYVRADIVEGLRSALERIVDPIPHMRREAEAGGHRLDGAMAWSLANDPEQLRSIARAALDAATRTQGTRDDLA